MDSEQKEQSNPAPVVQINRSRNGPNVSAVRSVGLPSDDSAVVPTKQPKREPDEYLLRHRRTHRDSPSTPSNELERLESSKTVGSPTCTTASRGSVSMESLPDKIQRLSTLTAQAHKLGEEHHQHTEAAKELEKHITEGELACGRMFREVLLLQQTLEIRKRHIKEDREKLSSELSLKESKSDGIREIISQINRLTMETNAEMSAGGLQHPLRHG